MDVSTVVIVIGVIVAFGIGLMIDVDEFAGGIFSKFKGTKDKEK